MDNARKKAMDDAMEIACQVVRDYGEDEFTRFPELDQMTKDRRLPFDHPSFQSAYAAICIERRLTNQYITIDRSKLS